MARRKGYYSISVVAQMFGVHQQTIRLYEKEGLISPKRTAGNTRIFSEEDVDRLEQIIHLTNKMGVNIAGVEMVLKLQKKVRKLQGEIAKLFDQMSKNLEEEGTLLKTDARKQAQELISLKHEKRKKTKTIDVEQKDVHVVATDSDEQEPEVVDDWEVDYEE